MSENARGAYAVVVSADTSDDPIRWMFDDEVDADAFAAAHNEGMAHPDASVSYEPISSSLEDPGLVAAFPEIIERARQIRDE